MGPSAAGGEATFHAAYLEAEIAKARELVAFAEDEARRLGIAASTTRCPMPDEEDLRKYGQAQYDKLREKHQTVGLWCGALEQLKTLLRWRAAAGERKHETTKDFCDWLELRVRGAHAQRCYATRKPAQPAGLGTSQHFSGRASYLLLKHHSSNRSACPWTRTPS